MTTDQDLFIGIERDDPEEPVQQILVREAGKVQVAYLKPGSMLVEKVGKRDERIIFENKSDLDCIKVHIHVMGMVSYARYRDWHDDWDREEYDNIWRVLGLEGLPEL